MIKLIKQIEFDRIKNKEIRSSSNFIHYPLIFVGNFIIFWYLTRDSEKSAVIFQFFKGLCINVHNSGLNVKFILRNVIDKTIIEKDIFLKYK